MKVNMYPHKKLPGWYTLDYRPKGAKAKRIRDHFDSREAAVAAKSALENKPHTTHPKLKEIVAEYLLWAQDASQGNLAASTVALKHNRLGKHIIPALGNHRVCELSQLILDGYTRGMPKTTALGDLRHLQALIRWMVKRHYADPLGWEIELPKYKRRIKRLPSNEQINAVIAALPNERQKVICRLMLLTGLRWNEVKHLRWEHYRDGAILLEVSKTGMNEVVTIPRPCLEWFESHRKGEGYVFAVGRKKTPPGQVRNLLSEVSKATGIKMTPHMFRHASATALYDLTEDIYAVQHHLRHASLSSTQIYTRYSEVRRKGNVNALTDAFEVDNGKNG